MKHLCYLKYYLILLLDLIVELVGRASRAECSSMKYEVAEKIAILGLQTLTTREFATPSE